LPAGYIPLQVEVGPHPALKISTPHYPSSTPFHFAALDETLPAYSGQIEVGLDCTGLGEDRDEELEIPVTLRYQACDATQCHLPETLRLQVPLRFLPHDWQRLDD
jgi:hypothetical protein